MVRGRVPVTEHGVAETGAAEGRRVVHVKAAGVRLGAGPVVVAGPVAAPHGVQGVFPPHHQVAERGLASRTLHDHAALLTHVRVLPVLEAATH